MNDAGRPKRTARPISSRDIQGTGEAGRDGDRCR